VAWGPLVRYLLRYLVRREFAYLLITATAIVLGLRVKGAGSFAGALVQLGHFLGLR
jgi:hypothetical protein